jgi:NAD(P)-dependent dehydrogenase (short-subunit alcohol dehydrogenase family)
MILGKTVFISGAAGGLGRVLVRKFADMGYKVIAVDIDSQGLERLKPTDKVMIKTLDITDIEQVRSYIAELALNDKGLDLLVCLAGIYDTFPVTEAGPEHLKNILSVNVFGTAFLVQGLLIPLIRNKGRVIVVSSESYKIQALFQPYMISKAALEAYCTTARQELALKGVILSVIRPGAIRTPLLKWMEKPADVKNFPVYGHELEKSRILSLRMIGKITTPDKVARLILEASESGRPKRIYYINNNPLLHLISFLPGWLADRVIINKFRINKKG